MELGIIFLPLLDIRFFICELRRLNQMHYKLTAFIYPETHPQIFVEPLQCVRHWEGALIMAHTIPAIVLLLHPLGGPHGIGRDCRRSTVHPTQLHLVL